MVLSVCVLLLVGGAISHSGCSDRGRLSRWSWALDANRLEQVMNCPTTRLFANARKLSSSTRLGVSSWVVVGCPASNSSGSGGATADGSRLAVKPGCGGLATGRSKCWCLLMASVAAAVRFAGGEECVYKKEQDGETQRGLGRARLFTVLYCAVCTGRESQCVCQWCVALVPGRLMQRCRMLGLGWGHELNYANYWGPSL